jgi:hypothetical protein
MRVLVLSGRPKRYGNVQNLALSCPEAGVRPIGLLQLTAHKNVRQAPQYRAGACVRNVHVAAAPRCLVGPHPVRAELPPNE